MKLLVLAHGFPPFCHSGTFRTEAFVTRFPKFGIHPIVFSGTSVSDVLSYRAPAHLPAQENAYGCDIYRANWQATALSSLHNIARRFPLLFTVVQRQQYIQVARRLLSHVQPLLDKYRPHAIYTTSPPHVTNVFGWMLARQTGLPWICDQRDPWTFDPWAKYRHRIDFVLQKRFEKAILSLAARVVANTPTAQRLLADMITVPVNKLVVVPNGYDARAFSGHNSLDSSPTRFRIIYTGLLSTYERPVLVRDVVKHAFGIDYTPVKADYNTRSPQVILPVLKRLFDHRQVDLNQFECVFVGSFSEYDKSVFSAFPYRQCLSVIDSVPQREAIRLCLDSSVLLLLQIHQEIRGQGCCPAVPGKLYSYLRTPRPILAIMQESDATNIIRQCQAGIVVSPYDTSAIERSIISLWREFERHGNITRPIHPLVRHFDWDCLAEQMTHIIRQSISRSHD